MNALHEHAVRHMMMVERYVETAALLGIDFWVLYDEAQRRAAVGPQPLQHHIESLWDDALSALREGADWRDLGALSADLIAEAEDGS